MSTLSPFDECILSRFLPSPTSWNKKATIAWLRRPCDQCPSCCAAVKKNIKSFSAVYTSSDEMLEWATLNDFNNSIVKYFPAEFVSTSFSFENEQRQPSPSLPLIALQGRAENDEKHQRLLSALPSSVVSRSSNESALFTVRIWLIFIRYHWERRRLQDTLSLFPSGSFQFFFFIKEMQERKSLHLTKPWPFPPPLWTLTRWYYRIRLRVDIFHRLSSRHF